MDDNSKLALPGAPSEKIRLAIETIYLELQREANEKQHLKLANANLRARVIQLESEKRTDAKVRLDLIRRIKLLEHSLLAERVNYATGSPPSRFAAPSNVHNLPRPDAVVPAGNANGHLGANRARFYRTLPSNLFSSPEFLKNAAPGRQFLREYLIELGYIKEAEQLDPRFRGAHPEDAKFDESAPVKLSGSNKSVSIARPEDDTESPTLDRPKGSFAKPNVKPPNVTANRRGSADQLLLEQKSGHSKLWKPTVPLRSHMDGVRTVSWHSADAVILTGSEDGTAKMWNISDEISLTPGRKKKTSQLLEPGYTFRGHTGLVTSVVLADTLNRVFTAGVDGRIIVWDLPPLTLDAYDECGRCMKYKREVLTTHTDAVWSVAAHPVPSMQLLFSTSADGSVGAWKLGTQPEETSKLLYQVAHPDTKNIIPTSIAVTPSDLKKLVVGYTNGDVGQIDIEVGKVIRVMKSMADSGAVSGSNTGNFHINDIVSHPTLSLCATAHVDNCVRLFDSTQGACVSVMQTHRDAVTSVSLDPSGLYLASASHDQSLRFWDLTSKKIIQDLDGYQTHRSKFDEAIHCVRYHPSLPLVATGGADSVAKVYQ